MLMKFGYDSYTWVSKASRLADLCFWTALFSYLILLLKDPFWLIDTLDLPAFCQATDQILGSSSGKEVEQLQDSGIWLWRVASSSRRAKRKWHSREERKIDKDYDLVLVPSDGGCVSGSESDDSDYSVGWLEPHGPGFQSDEELEDSFAVIVPCYGRCRGDPEDGDKGNSMNGLANISEMYAVDGNRFLEQWLSSLQNS
ncbi:hypothetical protein Leryth_020638 [Lithospermum erythrorhizon]|nr:hypothetical protein Leryth_020638 [Lithospermum erythrorhizon]